MWRWALFAAWCACAPPSGGAGRDAGASSSAGHLPAADADAGSGTGDALDAAALERFLRYEAKLLEVHAALARELPKTPSALERADAKRPDARATLRAKASAEEQARRQSGLSETQLDTLERMVNEIIPKRVMLASTDYEGLIASHQKLLASLPPESKDSVQRQIDRLTRTRDELSGLSAEREAFGSANVDLLLTKEKELVRHWNRRVQLWAGTQP